MGGCVYFLIGLIVPDVGLFFDSISLLLVEQTTPEYGGGKSRSRRVKLALPPSVCLVRAWVKCKCTEQRG